MQFTTAIVSAIAAFTFVQPIAAGTIVKGIFGKRSMVRGESNIFDRAAPAAGESASTNPVQCFEEGKGATIKVKANGPSSWTIHNVPASCETLAEHLASAKDVRYGTIVVNGDKSVTISNLPAAEVPKFKEWAAGHP